MTVPPAGGGAAEACSGANVVESSVKHKAAGDQRTRLSPALHWYTECQSPVERDQFGSRGPRESSEPHPQGASRPVQLFTERLSGGWRCNAASKEDQHE